MSFPSASGASSGSRRRLNRFLECFTHVVLLGRLQGSRQYGRMRRSGKCLSRHKPVESSSKGTATDGRKLSHASILLRKLESRQGVEITSNDEKVLRENQREVACAAANSSTLRCNPLPCLLLKLRQPRQSHATREMEARGQAAS